jgi:hypothetical protein
MSRADNCVNLFSLTCFENKNSFVGFEVLTVVGVKSSIFWDIMPYNLFKVNQYFRRTYCLHFCLLCNTEDWSSVFLWNIGWLWKTTWRYIPEDRTLRNHHCENLKSYMYRLVFHSSIQYTPSIALCSGHNYRCLELKLGGTTILL